MKTFTYTHHQGGDGKMVENFTEKKPICILGIYPCTVAGNKTCECFEYNQRKNNLITYDARNFSPSDNGKTFGEGEFEVKKQVITVKSGWIDTDDFTYDDVPESQRRIIAVPLSEKREERTQDELPEKCLSKEDGVCNLPMNSCKQCFKERMFTLEEMRQAFCHSYNAGKVHPGNNRNKDEKDYFQSKFSINLK